MTTPALPIMTLVKMGRAAIRPSSRCPAASQGASCGAGSATGLADAVWAVVGAGSGRGVVVARGELLEWPGLPQSTIGAMRRSVAARAGGDASPSCIVAVADLPGLRWSGAAGLGVRLLE